MTEAEAKTKWCPFARVALSHCNGMSNGPAANRLLMVDNDLRVTLEVQSEASACIGSACMAWRWGDPHTTVRNDVDPPEITTVTHGWCGLAGHPNAVTLVQV